MLGIGLRITRPRPPPSGGGGITVYGEADMRALAALEAQTHTVSWLPSDVSGLQLWLDASDISTLWQDSAGTTPVTTNGQSVGRWLDKSSNARVYSQSTAGRLPLYQSSGLGSGKPSVLGDDTDDGLLASVTWGIDGAQTLAVALKISSIPTSAEQDQVLSYRSSTPRRSVFLFNGSGLVTFPPWFFSFDTAVTTTGVGISDALDTNAHRVVVIYDGVSSTATSSYTIDLDGTSKTVVASTGTSSTGSTFNALLSRTDASIPAAVHVSEIVVYNAALSALNRTRLNNYLATKWN